MVWFDPASALGLRKALEARGWTFVGAVLDVNAGSESMMFAQSSSIVRVGSSARMRALISDAASPLAKPELSRIDLAQFDCSQRTVQFLNRQSFSDQSALIRATQINVPSPVVAVPPNSPGNTMLEAACSGRPLEALPTSEPDYATVPSRGGTGSGVLIAPQTVLTNRHVVASCGAVDVELAGQRFSANVRKQDATIDLALLNVTSLPMQPMPTLRPALVLGEAVTAAGFPGAGASRAGLSVAEGTISSLTGIRNNASQVQVHALTGPGFSGGPLLDRAGNLVGVVSAGLLMRKALQNVSGVPQRSTIALKAETVGLFLQSENLSMNRALRAQALDAQALAAWASGFTLKVICKP